MNIGSNGEVDSSSIYTRLMPRFSIFAGSLLPQNAAFIVNTYKRALDCNHCPALKIFHEIKMLFQNFEISRFSTIILLLIPFIFAKDSHERKGEANQCCDLCPIYTPDDVRK